MMPTHMEVHLPDNSRHLYMFDVAGATVNGPFDKLRSFFERPRTPFGYKRVVEQAPVQQAAQPAAAQTVSDVLARRASEGVSGQGPWPSAPG